MYMSSYHSSFSYLGKNSASDFHFIISHFDADSGESETGLSTESIYTASADGTSRNLYGTKYSGAEPVRITVIKQDGSDWTIGDNRLALKWLTGAKSDSWLDLYIGDEVRYRMLGHVQNVLQYKMDARIVGLIIVFESASPFAFSNLQTVTQSISGSGTIIVDNPSDDSYTFVKMKTTYKNTGGIQVAITNTTIGETTQINNLAINEIVTLNNNQTITSDKPSRIFGNDFNFNFPKLAPGTNEFAVTGTGDITFEYFYFIKIGNMATDINAVSDRICDDFGNIQIDMLDWSRISNTPTTIDGYGVTDVYTKIQVDNKFASFTPEDGYDKSEIDAKFAELESQIADLSYKTISITSLSNDVNVAEKGSVVASVTLKWSINKTPTTLVLDGVNLDTALTSYTYNNLNLTDKKTWTLFANDERGESSSKSTTVNFYNGVYYGASAAPSSYNSDFILSLTKKLSSNKVSSFEANSGEGQYFYYCLPVSMGVCSFNVGGFNGGFALVDTIEFVNKHQHSERYYIYRSDNANLGLKTIYIS